MSDYAFQHAGGCRCGAVRYQLHCQLDLDELALRACQCEFCLPRGWSYLSAPCGRLEVRVRDRRYLYAHVFGTGTADFMHCGLCNHLVFVRSEIEGRLYGLVLAQALDSEVAVADSQAMDYAGETLGVVNHLLDIVFESWLQGFREAHGLTGDHVHQRSALESREDATVQRLTPFLSGQHQTAAGPA